MSTDAPRGSKIPTQRPGYNCSRDQVFGCHVGFLLRSSETRPVARRRGMSNQNAQTDYYMGLVGGVDTVLLRLLPRVDAAMLREHVGPLLKFRADALVKAGADPTNGPKLTRAIVTACERTSITPADIGV